MSSQVAELAAAVIVGIALFWLVAQPLLTPWIEPVQILDPPDPEETPRGQALLALKEIEFDRATGKLSDEDYTELHGRYSVRALALMDAPAPGASNATHAPDPVEAALAVHVGQGARFCGSCGGRRIDTGPFCGHCGAAVAA